MDLPQHLEQDHCCIADYHPGTQILSDSELRFGDAITPNASFHRMIERDSGNEVGRVCVAARLNDWILFPVNPMTTWARTKSSFHPHRLVVRSAGDSFALVGLAQFPEWYPSHRNQGTYFRICWYPSDHVVFMAGIVCDLDSWDREEDVSSISARLSAEGCHAPSSSYVKGLAGRGIADNQFKLEVYDQGGENYRRQWQSAAPS